MHCGHLRNERKANVRTRGAVGWSVRIADGCGTGVAACYASPECFVYRRGWHELADSCGDQTAAMHAGIGGRDVYWLRYGL